MKKKILVCDDDAGILEVVTIILRDNGYAVIPIGDSEEVLTTVVTEKPDLILLDLWMPNISGEELIEHIQQQESSKSTPIIVISASKDTEKVAKSVGATDFIVKPFDMVVLENIVKKYLS